MVFKAWKVCLIIGGCGKVINGDNLLLTKCDIDYLESNFPLN
jgi:hypothetical protein